MINQLKNDFYSTNKNMGLALLLMLFSQSIFGMLEISSSIALPQEVARSIFIDSIISQASPPSKKSNALFQLSIVNKVLYTFTQQKDIVNHIIAHTITQCPIADSRLLLAINMKHIATISQELKNGAKPHWYLYNLTKETVILASEPNKIHIFEKNCAILKLMCAFGATDFEATCLVANNAIEYKNSENIKQIQKLLEHGTKNAQKYPFKSNAKP